MRQHLYEKQQQRLPNDSLSKNASSIILLSIRVSYDTKKYYYIFPYTILDTLIYGDSYSTYLFFFPLFVVVVSVRTVCDVDEVYKYIAIAPLNVEYSLYITNVVHVQYNNISAGTVCI